MKLHRVLIPPAGIARCACSRDHTICIAAVTWNWSGANVADEIALVMREVSNPSYFNQHLIQRRVDGVGSVSATLLGPTSAENLALIDPVTGVATYENQNTNFTLPWYWTERDVEIVLVFDNAALVDTPTVRYYERPVKENVG